MIGLWIDAQDDEVLGRLARAKEWHPMISCRSIAQERGHPSSGCLICHAFHPWSGTDYLRHALDDANFAVEDRYIELSVRFGDARIGHLISERARRVLEERNTNDSPVETELVPVSVHVSLNCEPVEVGA